MQGPDAALLSASQFCDVAAVSSALSRGADAQCCGASECHAALHIAIRSNDCKTAAVLLSGGADIAMAGAGGAAALHIASTMGFVQCTKLLIRNGAEVSAPDAHGMTPLMRAVRGNNCATIRTLLLNGADPSLTHLTTGRTAMHMACTTNAYDALCLLLSIGVEPNPQDCSGATPLSLAERLGYTRCSRAIMEVLERVSE